MRCLCLVWFLACCFLLTSTVYYRDERKPAIIDYSIPIENIIMDDKMFLNMFKHVTYKTSTQRIHRVEAKLKKVPLFTVEHIKEIGDNVTLALEKDKSYGKLKNGTANKPGIGIQPLIIPKGYYSRYSFLLDPLIFYFRIPQFNEVKDLLIHARHWHNNFWKIVLLLPTTLIYSPVGLVILMSILHLSMLDTGLPEIQHTLELTGDWWDIQSQLAFYFKFVEQDEFVVINKVFVDERFTLYPMYKNFLKSQFHGEVYTYVQSQAQQNIDLINIMFNKLTGGAVPSLVGIGEMNEETTLLFLSLLTFNGAWEQPFSPHDVRWEDFTGPGKELYQVDIMYSERLVQCDYISEMDVKGLLLPFKGGRHVMILMTHNINKRKTLDKAVDVYKLYEVLSQIEPYYVRIGIPKFKVHYTLPIMQLLYCLGIEKPLEEDVHYRRVANYSKNFKGNQIIQKIYLSIGENGSVPLDKNATLKPTLTTNSIPELIFKQPFLFAIMDIHTKSILLSAKIKKVGNERLISKLFRTEEKARMSTLDKEIIIGHHNDLKKNSLLRQYRRRRIKSKRRRRRRWRKPWFHPILTGPYAW